MSVLVIDGNNLLHRVHWISRKNPLITSFGEDVSTTFHFLRAVKSYVEKFQTNIVYVAWDKTLQNPPNNFRRQVVQERQVESKATSSLEYKAGRDTQRNTEVYASGEKVATALSLLGCRNIYPNNLEADDAIAFVVNKEENAGNTCIIVSSDSDLYQLVSQKTSVYNAQKKSMLHYYNFVETLEVSPEDYVIYKALVGDTSDNIKGVYGFGPVKAKKLLNTFKERWIFELTNEQKTIVHRNLTLVDLRQAFQTVPDERSALYSQWLQWHVSDNPFLPNFLRFEQYCKEKEFNSMLEDMNSWKNAFTGQFQIKVMRLK